MELENLLRGIKISLRNSIVPYVLALAACAGSDTSAVNDIRHDAGRGDMHTCVDDDQDGYAANCGEERDCDDHKSDVHRFATEYCDNQDNDCDGIVDNPRQPVSGSFIAYEDCDRDCSGNREGPAYFCSGEAAGPKECNYVSTRSDPDDTDSSLLGSVDPDCFYTYDAGNDVLRVDLGAPDAGVDVYIPMDARLPDLGSDVGYDVGADMAPDLGIDAPITCAGAAPLNTVQMGVCAGSVRRCEGTTWIDDYSSVSGYESLEVSCDGQDNDCDGAVDIGLTAGSRACSAGVGECERSGLEYRVCEGAAGWSADYRGCSAVAGEITAELCDGLDNNCDGEVDEGLNTILDNFNRTDGALGENLLDNAWTNVSGPWSIQNEEAHISWNSSGAQPVASSEIGYREIFDITVKFRIDSSGQGGAGVFLFAVNSDRDVYVDGLVANIGMDNLETHGVRRGTTTIEQAAQPISNGVDYLMRFAYDGTNLRLKLWENGAAEPAGFLIDVATENVDPSKTYMSIASDLDSGESASVFVDYILDNGGCF